MSSMATPVFAGFRTGDDDCGDGAGWAAGCPVLLLVWCACYSVLLVQGGHDLPSNSVYYS